MTTLTVNPHHPSVAREEIPRILLEELRRVGAGFQPDQLAYLAVTGKIEGQVRDQLAWSLHRRLDPYGLVVSREWRRTDLAILRDSDPLALVEAKALYAFNALSVAGRAEYLTKVRGDLAKSDRLAPEAQSYALVLTTHVEGAIPPQLRRHVVKYSSGMIGALARQGSAEALRTQAVQTWTEDLTRLGAPVEFTTIDAGHVWGLHVVVDGWLIGPVERRTTDGPV